MVRAGRPPGGVSGGVNGDADVRISVRQVVTGAGADLQHRPSAALRHRLGDRQVVTAVQELCPGRHHGCIVTGVGA